MFHSGTNGQQFCPHNSDRSRRISDCRSETWLWPLLPLRLNATVVGWNRPHESLTSWTANTGPPVGLLRFSLHARHIRQPLQKCLRFRWVILSTRWSCEQDYVFQHKRKASHAQMFIQWCSRCLFQLCHFFVRRWIWVLGDAGAEFQIASSS